MVLTAPQKTHLTTIYHQLGNAAAYSSPGRLYQVARKRFKKISKSDVVSFLEGETAYTLHKRVVKKFRRRKTYAKHLDYLWQLDLADVSSLAKENRGYRFLLVGIDILSRYAFVVPLKSKSGEDVTNAFKSILTKHKRRPIKIQTDLGKEFYNKTFTTFLRSKKIIHYSTENVEKAAVVERFNRTLKTLMFRYFTAKNTLSYWRILNKLVETYNSRIHRSIGVAPKAVTKRNQRTIHRKLYGDSPVVLAKPKFRVGDRVRIVKYRYAFTKAYLRGWTNEIFKIAVVLPTDPITYQLVDETGEDITGSFYAQELTRVRT